MKAGVWSTESGGCVRPSVPEHTEERSAPQVSKLGTLEKKRFLGGVVGPESKIRRLCVVCSGVLLCISCFPALGQFSLASSTIDGGGGTSSGGAYTVSGTIGQPAAGTMSGGQFTMEGGFWPGLVVPSIGEIPALYIQLSGTSAIISWSPGTAGFALETTPDLASAGWTSAPTGNPVAVPITEPARFYRLRKP